MKIKVNAILRGSDITADPGQEITVDAALGKKLIDSNAAEEIIEEAETPAEEPKQEEEEKPTTKKKGR